MNPPYTPGPQAGLNTGEGLISGGSPDTASAAARQSR